MRLFWNTYFLCLTQLRTLVPVELFDKRAPSCLRHASSKVFCTYERKSEKNVPAEKIE